MLSPVQPPALNILETTLKTCDLHLEGADVGIQYLAVQMIDFSTSKPALTTNPRQQMYTHPFPIDFLQSKK